jgi:hypothetical protein
MARAASFQWSVNSVVAGQLVMFLGEDVVAVGTANEVTVCTGWALVALLRKYPNDATILFALGIATGIVITNGTTGIVTITIPAADTVGLTPGSYDLEFSRTDSGQNVVLARLSVTLLPR